MNYTVPFHFLTLFIRSVFSKKFLEIYSTMQPFSNSSAVLTQLKAHERNYTRGKITKMEEKNPLHKSDSFTEEFGTNLVFQVDKTIFKDAYVQRIDDYKELHKTSVENPGEFWTEIANQFYWKERWDGKFMEYNFDLTQGDIFISFMKGAKTNICYNVLDRIVLEEDGKDRVAFYW